MRINEKELLIKLENGEDYMGWIGVDLDGTLAIYDTWYGIEHIGDPIPDMVDRVKRWIKEGRDVRIFTARISTPQNDKSIDEIKVFIEKWCKKHIGTILEITCCKDFAMEELWDDRCIQVIPNTGKRVDGGF